MDAPPDAVDVAARALRRRDRSRAQVAATLERAGVGEEERREALATLERIGYVDDARFAAARAAVLASRWLGDEAIRHDLVRSGVAADHVEAALAALEPEARRAAALVARRGRTARTAAQLARKGFAADAIEAAFAGEPWDGG
jgi:regulatory protein